MRRRDFISLLGGVAVAWPLTARAQQTAKIPRIGVLASGTPALYGSRWEAFRHGLRELGYVEGQNLLVEYRYAEGKIERLADLAVELTNLRVDLIVAIAAPETSAARRVTKTIPIVFLGHGDPVGSGDVGSLAKPGGNATGLSQLLPELSAKRLEVLKQLVPRVNTVAVLWNAANPTKVLDWRHAQVAAGDLGIALQSREVRLGNDFPTAFAAMSKQRPDALMTLDDPLTLSYRVAIVEFVAKENLPAIYALSDFVHAGGVMSYGPSRAEMYRRGATYVDKILKGSKPGDLPVEQAAKFELVINLKSAKRFGMEIPSSLLARADEVIE